MSLSMGARREMAQQALPHHLFQTFGLLVAFGCLARYLLDESGLDSPVLGALTLMYAVLTISLLTRAYISLLVLVMMPAMFGATPWNSPVKANIPLGEFPLYLFDLALIGLGTTAAIQGMIRYNHAAVFLRRHRFVLLLTMAGVMARVVESGIGGDTVRNAALFYYFPATMLSVMWLADRVSIQRILPVLYLKGLSFVALAQGIVLIGIALNHRESVLVSLHQGMSEPAGWLQWLPPGSLVLLSFCGAAFLPDRSTPIASRAVIALLLVYDAVTYGNRAMWVGIIAGLSAGGLIAMGWRKALISVVMAAATLATINAAGLRDTVKDGHNESSEWRLLAWTLTAASIADKPLAGHPFHSSLLTQVLDLPDSQVAIVEAALPISAQARSPHNSYLSLLFFGGLVQGGAIILFILGTVYRLGRALVRARKHNQAADKTAQAVFRGTIAVIVYSGFNVVLETPIEGTTFWIVIACAWLWAEHEEHEWSSSNRAG